MADEDLDQVSQFLCPLKFSVRANFDLVVQVLS